MASDLVDITGKFLDIGGRPLTGEVTIEPLPQFILVADQESVYSGGVTKALDGEGNLQMSILANPDWEYQISFRLTSHGNEAVKIASQIIKIPGKSTVPQLLAVTLQGGSYEPVIEFRQGEVGEIVVTGAQTDPADPGAILINLPA